MNYKIAYGDMGRELVRLLLSDTNYTSEEILRKMEVAFGFEALMELLEVLRKLDEYQETYNDRSDYEEGWVS